MRKNAPARVHDGARALLTLSGERLEMRVRSTHTEPSTHTDPVRRRGRELVGWGILTAVSVLSRFVIWLDGRLGEQEHPT